MQDTIAAISTIVGESALNVIKVSGKNSIDIVNKIFKGKNLKNEKTHTIHYGFIMCGKEKVDEVLISIFKSPKTYTREDVVEINCHGGIAVTNKILEILLENGARLAEPGEFIKRAYMNGRINLLEAEAVSDIISAKTEAARTIGIKGLTGESSKLIKTLREDILSLIANIEVNIDYPEYEDAPSVTNNLLSGKIKEIKEKIKEIIKKSENQMLFKNGIKVSIVGKPNVGKSSLLNKLIDEDKAIVTDYEGTTRDIVEGTIVLSGIEVNFTDTAGIRNTENEIEKIGVEKSYNAIENSDLVLFVVDGSEALSKDDEEILKFLKKKKLIIAINKTDMPLKINENKLKNYKTIKVSAKAENGTEELKERIIKMFKLGSLKLEDYTYLSNSRQVSLLKECLRIVNDIENAILSLKDVHLIEIDIKILWEKLGEMLGETYKEDILDEIFSKFCLGK